MFSFSPGLLRRVVSSVDQEGSSFESFFSLRTWQSTSIGDSVLSGVAYYSQIFTWLVVWNIFYFSIQLGRIIIPTDELIFFKMVKTTNQSLSWNDAHSWLGPWG